jgi:MFS family permease
MPLCGVYDVSVCRRRYSAWLNVLNINLQSFSFSQYDSGWVGFGSALAGAIGGVLSGFVADKLPKNLTRLIAALYLTSCAAMVCFTLICFRVLPYSLPAVYASSISVGFFMYARANAAHPRHAPTRRRYSTYPLFFELIMEIVFPVPEACASAVRLHPRQKHSEYV